MKSRRQAFLEQPHTRARGRLGEDEGVTWLRQQGYRTRERNVVTRAGEIDVIATDGDTLGFIEIKARASDKYGAAISAVSPTKQRKIARAASLYLARKPHDGPCRFDVLGMDLGDEGWRFTLIRDAFTVPG